MYAFYVSVLMSFRGTLHNALIKVIKKVNSFVSIVHYLVESVAENNKLHVKILSSFLVFMI